MKSKRIAAICLCITILTAGCAQIDSNKEQGTNREEYQDTVALVTDPYGPLLKNCAATNAGYYELLLSADGTANNILYTDFATTQRIYLCNMPNCTHDNDRCTSWCTYTAGGSYLFTSLDGQKLYYVQRGTEDGAASDGASTGKIFVMNADGSEKKVLVDIGANGRISDAIAADSQSIYIDINTVDSWDADPQTELWRVDAATGEVEVLVRKLPDTDRLFGAFDTNLLFQSQTETGYAFKAYDLKTRTFTDLISWNYSDFEGVNIVYGHRLFILKKLENNLGNLEVYDLRNMEKSTIQNVPIYAGDTTQICGFYDDENFVYDITDNTDPANIRFVRYYANISDGTVSELTLKGMRNGYQRPDRILCEAGGSLLVQYGSYTGTIKSVCEGRLTEMSMPDAQRMGLIAKADFFANTPNVTPIADSVISG